MGNQAAVNMNTVKMNTIKEESYQALFRRYYPRMFYYAKRIVGGAR